ncbi:hypothetical protein HK102_002974 [Quaeritorhiza haematococci]|nr:hypothetical protein HK102_002974 [Quaeritorhiza haematococci]
MRGTATMNQAEELKFATHFLYQIASRPVKYQPTYEPPLSAAVPLPAPASRPFDLSTDPLHLTDGSTPTTTGTSNEPSLTLTIKLLKSPQPLTITVSSRFEPISGLKKRIEALGGIPSAAQRLVYKGKGLVDTKTLMDYEIGDGETVHCLRKPGATGAVTPTTPTAAATQEEVPATRAVPASSPARTAAAGQLDIEAFRKEALNKAKDSSFWSGLEGFVDKEFSDPEYQSKVYNAFKDTYLSLLGSRLTKDDKQTVHSLAARKSS